MTRKEAEDFQDWKKLSGFEEYMCIDQDLKSSADISLMMEAWAKARSGSGWISVKDRLPENDNSLDHTHCWCALKDKKGNYYVEHLAWNHYHLVWDDQDEDDCSRYNEKVEYWQPIIMPAPPKDLPNH